MSCLPIRYILRNKAQELIRSSELLMGGYDTALIHAEEQQNRVRYQEFVGAFTLAGVHRTN